MIVNRVSGSHLNATKPKASLNEIPNIKLLPPLQDQELQCLNKIILTSTFQAHYFKVLEPFKNACM